MTSSRRSCATCTNANVRNAADITQKRVRESLRKFQFRKAYDHVTQVTTRFVGHPSTSHFERDGRTASQHVSADAAGFHTPRT